MSSPVAPVRIRRVNDGSSAAARAGRSSPRRTVVKGTACQCARGQLDAAFDHDDRGEEVKVVVEPAPGHEPGPALASDILGHCARRLAGYKRPRSVDFIETMPRDPNGKLYKRRPREPYREGRTRPM